MPEAVGEFAMYSPTSGILDPFGYTIALAENACQNGVAYYLDNEVTAIARENGEYIVTTNRAQYRCRWLVNSAGLGCGVISNMLGITGYRVIGSKGDYIILDRRLGKLLPMPIYPVPSNTYMGIHVTNTVDGNVIVGPNAEEVTDFSYYGVPKRNMTYLAESASEIWPHIHPATPSATIPASCPNGWTSRALSRTSKLKSGPISPLTQSTLWALSRPA